MRQIPKQIIRSFKQTHSVRMTAINLGIHKSTVYRWIRRARSGWSNHLRENIARKSTKPIKTHFVLTSEQRISIESLRLEKGFDVRKIVHILALPISHMTVYRFLKKKGLIKGLNHYRRPRFQNTIHMHSRNTFKVGYLQMDVKYLTPELTGLPWTCFEYAIIDIYSRYKDAVILNQLDCHGAALALEEILQRLPFKAIFIQTDNGFEFQGIFNDFCNGLKLKHHFIHKRTPNENAVIERSFRTDQEEFLYFRKTPFKNYDDLRNRFSEFLHYYNYERPHLGINLKTPMEIVANVVLH